MNKKYVLFLSFALCILMSKSVLAKDLNFDWSEIRFFLNQTQFVNTSSELKAIMQADQIEEFNQAIGFGLEATAQLVPWFKIGTKFKGIFSGSNKAESAPPAQYYLSYQQYSVGFTGRINLVSKDLFLLDLFGELGLSNNSIEIATSSGKASWKQDAHFYQRAGMSAGVGSAAMKFYVEGGYEMFKLDNLSHSGVIGSNISGLDFSGPYMGVGLIISGVPSWIKPSGASSN